jgi:DNA polymerase-3 subunit gamma/tau
VPAAADDVSLTPDERRRGAELAGKLPMRALTRAWQILFKGYDEIARASNGLQAAEMALIRLAYAADLPSPDDLIARLANQPAPAPSLASMAPISRGPSNSGGGAPSALRVEAPRPVITEAIATQPAPLQASAQPAPQPVAQPAMSTVGSYKELIALATAKRDVLVKLALEGQMRPLSFEQGRIEVALADGADPGIIATLSARLQLWTGQRWLVTVSSKPLDGPTIRQEKEERAALQRAQAHDDPLVQAILNTFPGAKVVNVKVKDEPDFLAPDLPPPPPEEDDE